MTTSTMADDEEQILSALKECEELQAKLAETEAKFAELVIGRTKTVHDDALAKLKSMSDAFNRLTSPELLQKHLTAASSMTKEQREPLMKYFRGMLQTRKRFYHPTSAKDGVNPQVEAGFAFFPNLPVELQRLVWLHSLPGARIFEIVQGCVNSLVRINDAKAAQHSVVNIALSCKLAYTCVIERYEKVELRYLDFSSPFSFSSTDHGQQFYYVDWEKDIFYEPRGNMETFFAPSRHHLSGDNHTDLMKIKNVALHIPSVSQAKYIDDFLSDNMPKIKQIIYVADCERRLEAPRIDLEERAGDWYPSRLGDPGFPDHDRMPLVRTSIVDDMDHPYRVIMEEEIGDMAAFFRTDDVQEAYKGIFVCMEIWRRAAKD